MLVEEHENGCRILYFLLLVVLMKNWLVLKCRHVAYFWRIDEVFSIPGV